MQRGGPKGEMPTLTGRGRTALASSRPPCWEKQSRDRKVQQETRHPPKLTQEQSTRCLEGLSVHVGVKNHVMACVRLCVC